MLAGIYIAMGGLLSLLIGYGFPEWTAGNPGLQKLLSGCMFPLGLILVVLAGAELFTGNNAVLIPGFMKKKYGIMPILKNWTIVYIGNFIGAIFFVYVMVWCTGIVDADPWKSAIVQIAQAKVNMSGWVVFLKGIGANWLVCDLRQAQLGAGRLFTLSGPITMGIMWTCSVLILFFGGRQIIFRTTGLLTGQLVSLVNYAGMAVNSLSMISWLVMSLSRAQASLVRINEVLDEKIDITDGPSDAVVESGSIDFEDVCFSYTRDPDKLALRHVTLHIASGETIGVIGGTGEGKSTLVSLIPRFYDALSGTVKVDGRDVREYTLEKLRSGVSMVLQNGSLFSGTIADNLRWADPNATREQMQAACAIARADEYIDRFPDAGAERRQPVRRPAPAPADRPGHPEAAKNPDPGRLHLRRGYGHRRAHPPLSADGPARRHQGHHCPAHQLHHVLRPHCGAGPGASGGHGHPSGAAVPQPYLP